MISPMHARYCLTPRSVLVRALAAVPVCLALAAPFAAQAQTYTITDLGTLGGSFSIALGVNSHGQVIGNSFTTGDQDLHAFIYSDGRMRDLGTLGGSSSSADAIDDLGRVFGTAYTAGNASSRAFLYADGRMIDIGPLAATSNHAPSVNAAGEVAGTAYIGGDDTLSAFPDPNRANE